MDKNIFLRIEVLFLELGKRAYTLGTCESCTGGLLGHWITEFPGVSSVYMGGIQAYSNKVKISLVGVDSRIIQCEGAVSASCAAAMAEGAKRVLGVDVALSTTGIAGPGGGTSDKSVGLAFIGISGPYGTQVKRFQSNGNRSENKIATSLEALDFLYLYLSHGATV